MAGNTLSKPSLPDILNPVYELQAGLRFVAARNYLV
ncbi:hypothetical protein FMEAI12_2900017 [Parafrankia sp. Ea1.12]|nr:hypothetical protein FMEAI12_2900017 [Parafrankia sp. Ea1.12]